MGRVALLTALVATAASSYAQIPAASSARSIPTEVEQQETRVTQIIARAEDHFRKGKLNLEDSKREQAREEFDKAVDSILESGFDVRASQKLQTYYLELVERIYREEVPLQQPANNNAMLVAQNNQTQESATQKLTSLQVGFRDQKFEPSPLDELSKLVLTDREKEVMRLRYGLGADREYTLEEIGKRLSVTRERVRQIESRALQKLRSAKERETGAMLA